MSLLNQNDAIVVIIDIQEKLTNAVYDKNVANVVSKLVQAAKILDIPVLITEQYPKGLGETVAQIKENADAIYFEKTSFSSFEDIKETLKKLGKKQIIICGIEAHICVHQTANDLLEAGFEVHVLKDGVASRKEFEFAQGINRMEQNGATVTCLEIVLFELLKGASNPHFKAIQTLIK
jgi:nicotinamidase-related amidase